MRNSPKLIYEVNIQIEPSVAEEYLTWLRPHVQHMLQIDGFHSAEIFTLEKESDRAGFVVHYHVRDKGALENYFLRHASAMRAEGIQKFGGKFSVERRVLERMG